MSLAKELIDEINRANAQSAQAEGSVVRVPGKSSTGPRSVPGKQRSRMNAVKHLSGQHLMLQDTELAAYNRMSASMLNDLNPKSEPEFQIAQKIVDINFRLNRLTAIENNLFNFGLTANESDMGHDDRLEVMAAQTRAWTEHAGYFDTLGRYENRLSRQLLKYQEEFERLQAVRKVHEIVDSGKSAEEKERDKFDPASFGPIENSYRILTHLPAPKPVQPAEIGSAGDLVAGGSSPERQIPENMAA
jgi:hypothetical protein